MAIPSRLRQGATLTATATATPTAASRDRLAGNARAGLPRICHPSDRVRRRCCRDRPGGPRRGGGGGARAFAAASPEGCEVLAADHRWRGVDRVERGLLRHVLVDHRTDTRLTLDADPCRQRDRR